MLMLQAYIAVALFDTRTLFFLAGFSTLETWSYLRTLTPEYSGPTAPLWRRSGTRAPVDPAGYEHRRWLFKGAPYPVIIWMFLKFRDSFAHRLSVLRRPCLTAYASTATLKSAWSSRQRICCLAVTPAEWGETFFFFNLYTCPACSL